ncbi:hypothetical protein F4804DRAFT_349170 [Jackrogersella minutella]|nr:hypothetical protein F4804DRAFT_349170 [Jackrogersella minutella]
MSRTRALPRLLCPPPTRRPFTFLAPPGPQTLTAARRLPYDHKQLYGIIADVDSYQHFLPYCQSSRVTSWVPSSSSSSSSERWPWQADLTVGWGGIQETYTSRIVCQPARGVLEAISGGDAPVEVPGVFKSLVTRWTVRAVEEGDMAGAGRDWSDVQLSIKYQFANPLYTAVGSAMADKVAPAIVKAFVERAELVLGETGKKASNSLR